MNEKNDMLPTGIWENSDASDAGTETPISTYCDSVACDSDLYDNAIKFFASQLPLIMSSSDLHKKILENVGEKAQTFFSEKCANLSNYFQPYILPNGEPSVDAINYLNKLLESIEAMLNMTFQQEIFNMLADNNDYIAAMESFMMLKWDVRQIAETRAILIGATKVIIGKRQPEFSLYLDLFGQKFVVSRSGSNPFSESAIKIDINSDLWAIQSRLWSR